MIFVAIICWISFIGILHSYIFYPIFRYYRSNQLTNQDNLADVSRDKSYRKVSVIMSVFNEETCILDKLDNLFELKYPNDRIDFYIGSDASFDATNDLIAQYPALESRNWTFKVFEERRGKPSVVNDLVQLALEKNPAHNEHLLLVTDASILMNEDCLMVLESNFKDSSIALVDSNILNQNNEQEGIGSQERDYISMEAKLKYWESIDGGYMIGPFGGCYLIRSSYFKPIPSNYLVDDFFVAMNVFEQGGKCINDLNAVCKEYNSSYIKEEFKRKKRIAAGNFQNLVTFKHLLWPLSNTLSFNFLSHKVLRWLGPMLILFIWISSLILGLTGNLFYFTLFLCCTFFLVILPLFDFCLEGLGVHQRHLRFIRYFVVMNIAILMGFIKFLQGIQSGTWEPPKRETK